MREQRIYIAQETLKILQQGFYIAPSGKSVDISNAQTTSENSSYLITPGDGNDLISKMLPAGDVNTSFAVVNDSTVSAIIDNANGNNSVGVLNFASAKNPGGGFLNGSMAQEEALSYSSGLYNTQINHMEYYEKNKTCDTMMYTDFAIFSPDVVFFRDSNFNLLEEPVVASVLTLPAVNMKQVIEKQENVSQANQAMKNRMCLSLSIFANEAIKTLILGAYGCGVFGNNPNGIAQWWKDLLVDENYDSFFDKIVFAVLDKPGGDNIKAFEYVFKV